MEPTKIYLEDGQLREKVRTAAFSLLRKLTKLTKLTLSIPPFSTFYLPKKRLSRNINLFDVKSKKMPKNLAVKYFFYTFALYITLKI